MDLLRPEVLSGHLKSSDVTLFRLSVSTLKLALYQKNHKHFWDWNLQSIEKNLFGDENFFFNFKNSFWFWNYLLWKFKYNTILTWRWKKFCSVSKTYFNKVGNHLALCIPTRDSNLILQDYNYFLQMYSFQRAFSISRVSFLYCMFLKIHFYHFSLGV